MKAIKVISGMLVLILLGLAVKGLFFPSSKVTANAITESQQSEMQVFTLSWGKLNYNPEVITVKKGRPVKIVADTKRLQGCFRSITIPDLDVQKSFNENGKELVFTPQKEGTFKFGCSMGMGSGKLVVE